MLALSIIIHEVHRYNFKLHFKCFLKITVLFLITNDSLSSKTFQNFQPLLYGNLYQS